MITKTARRVRDSKGQLRDYAKEYTYHGTPEQITNRSRRNQARRILGLKRGDPREVDHRYPLSKGGSNNIKNLRAVRRKTNRQKFTKSANMAITETGMELLRLHSDFSKEAGIASALGHLLNKTPKQIGKAGSLAKSYAQRAESARASGKLLEAKRLDSMAKKFSDIHKNKGALPTPSKPNIWVNRNVPTGGQLGGDPFSRAVGATEGRNVFR